MKKFLFGAFIFLIIAVFTAISAFLFIQNQNLQGQVAEFELSKFQKLSFVANPPKDPALTDRENMDAVETQPKDVSQIFLTGWIPDWDYADGVSTLKQYGNQFGSVSPFWYELNGDGTLKQTQPSEDSDLTNYASQTGIDLIPTITNFNADIFSEMLNNPSNMQKHIDEIIRVVSRPNITGIDLDYESIYLKDKELFFEFLQKLSIEMNKIEKQLVFTVMPKWGDKDVVYLGLPETRKVQDYKRIADLVDELRIMTYEYTGRSSGRYGPNAPLKWMEDTIRYAIAEGVPRDKLVLGVPTYSYDYTKRSPLENITFYPVLKAAALGDLQPAVAYYNTTVDDIKSKYNIKETFNEEWGEMVLEYTFQDGTERVIVYPTTDSIKLRHELAAEFGIKGVAYWRLGDEGSIRLD